MLNLRAKDILYICILQKIYNLSFNLSQKRKNKIQKLAKYMACKLC